MPREVRHVPAVSPASAAVCLRMLALALTVMMVATPIARADAPPTGSALKSALVLPVNWVAGNGSPAAPQDRTLTEVTAQIGSIDKQWYQSVSHGQFPGWQARGMGPFSIAPPRMDVGGVCADQFQSDVADRADQAALAQGVNPADYDTVVYYYSYVPQCPWAGLSDGRRIWINGRLNTATTVHELGHTLQLGHGLSLRCRDANGNPVALSSTCDIIRYGDPFNVMGSGSGSFSAIQQFDVGWMSGRMADVPTGGGSYTVQPLETQAPGLQALRVTDGTAKLWIEYRQPIGVDSSLPPEHAGVLIYRQMPDQGMKSILLDMTPATASFSDARLPVGATWTLPDGITRITVNSASAAGAQITIAKPRRSVPNVVGMTLTQASTAIRAAGFTVGQVGYAIDYACAEINTLRSQSPGGGVLAPVGSAVALSVWRAPVGGCA